MRISALALAVVLTFPACGSGGSEPDAGEPVPSFAGRLVGSGPLVAAAGGRVITPTECVNAWAMGVKLLKIFPIGVLGVSYLKAVMGPLGHMSFMCNGGINPATTRDFIDAGAVACGAAGWMTGDGSWPLEAIRARAKILRQTIDDVRSDRPETLRV